MFDQYSNKLDFYCARAKKVKALVQKDIAIVRNKNEITSKNTLAISQYDWKRELLLYQITRTDDFHEGAFGGIIF